MQRKVLRWGWKSCQKPKHVGFSQEMPVQAADQPYLGGVV